MNGSPEGEAVGAQTPRRQATANDVALHEQLYRYAEDLQVLLEDRNNLEQRYDALAESYRHLRESRSILDNLVQSSRDMHLTTDTAGRIVQSNAAARLIAPPSVLIGQSLRNYVLPDQLADFDAMLAEALRATDSVQAERELRLRRDDPDAGILIVAMRLLPIQRDGAIESVHWIGRDVTRMREAESGSQVSSLVFRSAIEGIMITDLTGNIVTVNPAFTRITGYSAEEVIGRNAKFLKSGVQDPDFYRQFWHELAETGQWQGEIFNRKKNGDVFPEWLTVTGARDSSGKILSYIAVFSDMSRLQEAERRLSYLAYHDPLTGLPNRLLLGDRLRQAMAQARRAASALAVLFIDLDGFKALNDKFGHEAGDLVLQETAQRIKNTVRDSDTVARLGGDEFVIVAAGLEGQAAASSFAEKIIAQVTQPINNAGREMQVGCSIGIAHYQEDQTPETLLRNADVAMYRSKQAGGWTSRCYEEETPDAESESGEKSMEGALRQALARDELRLVYQPQVSLSRGMRLIGVEALLRWRHPVLGDVPTEVFIQAAERNGTILAIGEWCLKTACRQLKDWQRAGLDHITMAVNVSPRQLATESFAATVQGALAEAGLPPAMLELEVKEREAMVQTEAGRCRLQPIQAMSVRIAIDDFGTGSSSIPHLRTLPVQRIKIDRSFVLDIEQSEDARAVSKSIIDMGHALGLQVVAEGVETESQLATLSEQGCQVVQGYLLGRPMSGEELLTWARRRGDCGMAAAAAAAALAHPRH